MGDIKNLTDTKGIEKIRDLAKDADICLFTTNLSSVPLTARQCQPQLLMTKEIFGF